MENDDMYNAPMDIHGRNSTIIEEITHNLTPKPLIYCYSFDLNNQTHIINGIPILPGEQGEPISGAAHLDGRFMNPVTIADSSSLLTPQGKTVIGDAPNHIANNEFQENLENSASLSPSLEALGSYMFNNWHDVSNPLSSTFGDNNGYVEVEVPGNGKWNNVLPYSSVGNIDPNGWNSSNIANLANLAYSSSNCSNELSLSLATSPTTGQCSEMSCSDVTHSSMELSLGSNKHVQFSSTILGSRYLAGIQEILAQIAKYSFENLEEVNCSGSGDRARGNKSASAVRRVGMNQNVNPLFEAHDESLLPRHAAESNKSQLLMLLQLVDNRYTQCLDEIHTVVSAFHAATELDPHMHAHFALQSVSLLYKDLRERISSYILAMGSSFNGSCSQEEKEWSVETSFIQKQWALQQLKRKDQLWRPQRGLPERSVSVLRAWMFQNFLHPYPKDAEKHLLAVKSGLTRSQVSNWFINARVRLWKPMIEEMYAEMNRRKACRNEEGIENNHRSRISINNQMFNFN